MKQSFIKFCFAAVVAMFSGLFLFSCKENAVEPSTDTSITPAQIAGNWIGNNIENEKILIGWEFKDKFRCVSYKISADSTAMTGDRTPLANHPGWYRWDLASYAYSIENNKIVLPNNDIFIYENDTLYLSGTKNIFCRDNDKIYNVVSIGITNKVDIVEINNTIQLGVEIRPTYLSNKKIIWNSSNSDVAQISTSYNYATVKCTKVGQAVIKIHLEENESLCDSFVINVVNLAPPYSESFYSSYGKFTNVLQGGYGYWSCRYGYVQANGFVGSSFYEGNYYLISPKIDLSNMESAHVCYDYIVAYNNGHDENQKVLVSYDYNDNKKPDDAIWVTLKSKHISTTDAPTDWNVFNSADITVPQKMMDKVVRIAFAYNYTAENSATWRVRNFSILPGKGNEEAEDDGLYPLNFKDFCNGDFETWTNDSLCLNWHSYSNASTASTSKSNEAHTGNYAIHIANTSVQKRLAYYETLFEPGTYKVSFYAKAATADNAKLVPGYGIITSKTDVAFIYDKTNEDANNYTIVNNTQWTKVEYTFTLNNKQMISLVIQNAKQGARSRDLLIDDYTIKKIAE